MASTTQYSAPRQSSDGLVQPIEELAQQGKEKVGQLADQVKEGLHGAPFLAGLAGLNRGDEQRSWR